jgi:hypothetical protein
VSYQVQYRHASSGIISVVVLLTAAQAAEEKRHLENLGYIVTAIVPDEPIPPVSASPI